MRNTRHALFVVAVLFGGMAKADEPSGKPMAGGRIVVISADGKSLTLETPPGKPGLEPQRTIIRITERTRLEYRDVDRDEERKPAVGYEAMVWLEEGSADRAAFIRLTPVQVIFRGKVVAVADKTLTLETDAEKRVVRLLPNTKVVYAGIDKSAQQPTVGYEAQVWLRKGSKDEVSGIQFNLPGKAPPPDEKPTKPTPTKEPGKPAPTKEPGKPSVVHPLPTRDPAPFIAALDREWRRALTEATATPADEADDAEFLRRVTIDLTGRVPTVRKARAFLDSRDSDKRRKLVDELLSSPEYGRHFGTIWRDLLAPPVESSKPQPDTLSPWLADQFNRNRGWDAITRDLLTATGPIRTSPQLGFILANGEALNPKPEMLADATARLFLGVELRCAQCHDHPFAKWKQADFWALAAFFSRVQPDSPKGGPNVAIIEGKTPLNAGKDLPPGAVIVVQGPTGPQAGKVVRARFPGGAELAADLVEPYRPRFVDWLTARDNPYFARAAVNRAWAHLFHRGQVMPLDGFSDDSTPANAALLDVMAREFADSGHDVKHLLRGLCLSQAYQRSSKGTAKQEERLFARMAVKPLRPEVLYDSLTVVLQVEPAGKNAGPRPSDGKGGMLDPRETFIRFFRSKGDPSVVHPGIPQVLYLLNGPLLDDGGALVDRLADTPRAAVIETLFLGAYARRPTAKEVETIGRYLEKQTSAREGYSGVLWTLLNSSEFLLNH